MITKDEVLNSKEEFKIEFEEKIFVCAIILVKEALNTISFKNIDGTELLFKLDEYGICASAGSACSTSSPAPSHVLTSIGLSKEEAYGTLRISFGRDNTKDDVDYLIQKLKEIIWNKVKSKEIERKTKKIGDNITITRK